MQGSNNYLSHSKYFQTQFNHALFHGSLRFYFPQYLEGMALRIYGMIEKRALLEAIPLDYGLRFCPPINILVMFYPNRRVFLDIFQQASPTDKIQTEILQNDTIIGVCGTLEAGYEENLLLDEIINTFRMIGLQNQDLLLKKHIDSSWRLRNWRLRKNVAYS